MLKPKRVEELQEYFKTHNKSKEQKAHTSKVGSQHFHTDRLVGDAVDTAQVMCEFHFTAKRFRVILF